VWGLAEEAGDGVVADGQGELVLAAFGTEGGLLGAMLGAAAQLGQRRRFTGDRAAQPCADGVAGAAERAGGGLAAIGLGEGDALLMQPVTIGLPATGIQAGAGHAGRRTSVAHRCGKRSTPSTSPQGGHDLPSLSQGRISVYCRRWRQASCLP